MEWTRRKVLAGVGLAAAGAAMPRGLRAAGAMPFRLAVINDEISQDFEQCCKVAAHDFGLGWMEIRGWGNKNVSAMSDGELEDARKLLDEHKLRVTDIASPVFKADWPGAPLSKSSERHDSFHANYDAHEQDHLLDRCIAVAKKLGTDRIRCFDYWRLEDVKPYRAAINAKLKDAAERCAKSGMVLMLENEFACNTGTGEEAAGVLAAVPNKNFMLNWDPGNAAALGSTPYPNGWNSLPKDRIGNVHVKNVKVEGGGKFEWQPVDVGVVDWVGQIKALRQDGYRYGLSLETHWRGAGTPEASTRVSMAGLKKVMGEAGVPAPPTVG